MIWTISVTVSLKKKPLIILEKLNKMMSIKGAELYKENAGVTYTSEITTGYICGGTIEDLVNKWSVI